MYGPEALLRNIEYPMLRRLHSVVELDLCELQADAVQVVRSDLPKSPKHCAKDPTTPREQYPAKTKTINS